mmetsp:Transcript_59822/g.185529  ORF Transcript_59822/g.185529 Transcript_59822/m.185529 type:complete len:284 (+) Transcript_59822:74-925(+)
MRMQTSNSARARPPSQLSGAREHVRPSGRALRVAACLPLGGHDGAAAPHHGVGALQQDGVGTQRPSQEMPRAGLGLRGPLVGPVRLALAEALRVPRVPGLAPEPGDAAGGPGPAHPAALFPLARARAVGGERDGRALRVPRVPHRALVPARAARGPGPRGAAALLPGRRAPPAGLRLRGHRRWGGRRDGGRGSGDALRVVHVVGGAVLAVGAARGACPMEAAALLPGRGAGAARARQARSQPGLGPHTLRVPLVPDHALKSRATTGSAHPLRSSALLPILRAS